MHLRNVVRLPVGITALAGALLGAACLAPAAETERLTYNEHIRPLLSERCFACHGPDEGERQANLRLDTFAGATEDLGGYQAVVPGDPDASILVERISTEDESLRMPPADSGVPPLSREEIERVRRWIAGGAEYQDHWAFLPLNSQLPPLPADRHWPHNPIDHFILARLEQHGITPSPEADRATLMRRVSLDLTGLLPTPEEVEAFVNDPDPLAYERLVDRLLASPHYGERWGRHWLDQARYADSHGYTIDGERTMWPYRDWVIWAHNQDLPFDRFTIEQLAGDLLDNPTKQQLIATAFHRNTLINQEGGTDAEQFRVEATVDRVNTTGAVWLGLTLGCAQCHSHKFDPISHTEYYQIFAFFNSTADVNNVGPTVPVAPGEVFGVELAPPTAPPLSDEQIAELRIAWEARQLARLEPLADAAASWQPAEYAEYRTGSGGMLERLDDNSLLYDGSASPREHYVVRAVDTPAEIAAVRLRVLTHESLPKMGPGRASNGNFVLTRFELYIDGQRQNIASAFADHEQPNFGIAGALDDDPKSGWAVNVGKGQSAVLNANHEAVFVLDSPVSASEVEVRMYHETNDHYTIGRFALDFSPTVPLAPSDATLLAALQTPADQRSAEHNSVLQAAFERDEPRARRDNEPAPGTVPLMVMRDLDEPRPTYRLTRGDFTRPDIDGGVLRPDVPQAIAPPLDESSGVRNRLTLARWLVDPRNPLTPRVVMNRIWMRYFGRGLVETEEDFGSQGTYPTHPRLLDWLAAEFQRNGWSMKHMHRTIVTSATYRQSSHARPDLREMDPRNLLLARQERLRLEAEVIRDAALSASGMLTYEIGGPSVHPPQPDGVYAFTQTNKAWKTTTGRDRYRRALYTFFYRSAPYPLMTTFDAPDFQTTCTRRVRSNTPLQSLTLSNDIVFVELARALAVQLLDDVPGEYAETLDARIDRAIRRCLCRAPMEEERELLRAYVVRQTEAFAEDQSAAEQLAGDVAWPPGTAIEEAAALVCLARAVMNTDNFVTRE